MNLFGNTATHLSKICGNLSNSFTLSIDNDWRHEIVLNICREILINKSGKWSSWNFRLFENELLSEDIFKKNNISISITSNNERQDKLDCHSQA
jgi:hypothetical protein